MKFVGFLASFTILILPAYVIRFQFGPVPSTLLETLILLTVATWSVVTFRERGVSAFLEWRKSWIFILGLGLTLVALADVFYGPNLRAAAGIWRAYFLEPLLFGWVVTDLTRRGYGKPLLWALLGSGLWIAAMSVAQISGHLFTNINERSLAQINLGRAVAVYYTGNAVALYLGPIMMLATALTLRYPSVVALLGLLTWGILDSKSRGGLGASISGFFLIYIGSAVARYIPKLNRLFWQSLPFLPILLAVGVGLIFFNVTELTSYSSFTKTTRLCIWEGTQEIILSSPVTGTGLTGFGPAYAKTHTCNAEDLIYPHNFFLNFWAETGVLGLLFITTIFIMILYRLRFAEDRILALGLAVGFLYLLIHGQVDVPYFKNDLAAEFWVLAGLAAAITDFKINLFGKS